MTDDLLCQSEQLSNTAVTVHFLSKMGKTVLLLGIIFAINKANSHKLLAMKGFHLSPLFESNLIIESSQIISHLFLSRTNALSLSLSLFLSLFLSLSLYIYIYIYIRHRASARTACLEFIYIFFV